MNMLSNIKNAVFTVFAGVMLNPLEAVGQDVSKDNIPNHDPKTFLDKRGYPVYAAKQYGINTNDPRGPRNEEKRFLKGMKADGAIGDDYKSIVPKIGSRTTVAIVVGDTVDVYLADNAGLDDMTTSRYELQGSTTHELQRFKNNGNGALDGGDKPLDRTIRMITPAETHLRDDKGQINQEEVSIVNIVYQDLENDPDNFYLYRAYVDAQGNQIVHDDQGRQLRDVGALKFIPESEEAKQACQDLLDMNAYPTGIKDFRAFWNEFTQKIYHDHYDKGGTLAEVIAGLDIKNGDLSTLGPVLSGKVNAHTLHPTSLNGVKLFEDNKDALPVAQQTKNTPMAIKSGIQ